MSRARVVLSLAIAFVLPAEASALVDELPEAPAVAPPVELPDIAGQDTTEALIARADPMIGKINRARRRSGRRPLRPSRSLSRSSRRFGRHLMRIDRFGHDSHIWASRRFRRKGEVLAFHSGWRVRRSSTVRGWMHSPSHRAVLLSRAYRYVGVAAVRGRFGGRRATIWVGQVAR